MKSKLIGAIVLLAVSEVFGVFLGLWFFRVFNQTVPPAVLTSFNKATAQGMYVTTGLGAGFLIFVWTLLAIGASNALRARGDRAGTRTA